MAMNERREPMRPTSTPVPRPGAARVGQDYLRERYEDRAWDGVRWGPIVAGFATTITTLVVLTLLGLAIGLSTFEPTADGDDIGTAAAIWGAATAVIAFLAGGFVAGWTARTARMEFGVLNGFLVGALTLVLSLWLVTSGAANILGAVGTNIQEVVDVTTGDGTNVTTDEVLDRARAAYDDAEASAWWSFAGVAIALAAAAGGGAIGFATRGRRDVVYETPAREREAA
jgi:hypothetical protein